jgi:hypothetical protein
MKKLISSLLVVISSISLVTVSTASQANAPAPILGVNLLKQKVTKFFLQTANDAKSPLHKKLIKLNQEYIDGRNENGVIPKTLIASNLQLISITGENRFGSYCNAIAEKPGHFQCDQAVSETYLILIPYKLAVHKAIGHQSFKFAVKAVKTTEWKRDEADKEYDRRESIKLEEPVEAYVQIGSETY